MVFFIADLIFIAHAYLQGLASSITLIFIMTRFLSQAAFAVHLIFIVDDSIFIMDCWTLSVTYLILV